MENWETPFIFNGGTETLSVGGEYVSSKPQKGNNRNTDKLDVAVIKLNKETTKAYWIVNTSSSIKPLLKTGYITNTKDYACV